MPRSRRTSPAAKPRPQVWVLVAAVAATAAVFHLGVHEPLDITAGEWLLAGALLVGFGLAEFIPFHGRLMGRQVYSLSVSELPLIAGLALALDPTLLVAVRVLGAAPAFLLARRQRVEKVAFNLATQWLEVTVAVATWRLLIGDATIIEPRGWLAVLGTVLLTSLLGGLLVSAVISLSQGKVELGLGRNVVADLVASAANACFAVVAAFVLDRDWRAAWSLVVIGAGFLLAYYAYQALQRRQAATAQLAEFSRVVSAELGAEAVVRAVLAEVRLLLAVDVAEICLHRSGEQDPTARHFLSKPGGSIEVGDGAEGTVADAFVTADWDGSPILATRRSNSHALRRALRRARRKDAIVVPLRSESNRVLGTLLVADRIGDVGALDRHDLTLLVALANHACVALDNGRLADRLRSQATRSEYQARHDALTGLANRNHFQDRITQQMGAGGNVGVLVMDIDRFKEINETLGHDVGDRVLVEVARRLAHAAPAGAVIARLGGDEFAVSVAEIDRREAVLLGQTLRRRLRSAIALPDLRVEIEASIGIALAPEHGNDAATLLQRADIAMYDAREARTGIEAYDASKARDTLRRLGLVPELRRAIDKSELVTHYQPKVGLDAREVTGVEALIRWLHPKHGLLGPNQFIPVAEQTGLIRPLTISVLREALARCALWRKEGLDLSVAVNLSPRVLDDSFADDVEVLLDEYAVPRQSLTLEITEECMVTDPAQATKVLRRLSELGVSLSVDDFGTGYSSLAYLKQLPVDEVKIDKAFVQSMGDGAADNAIVSAIVEMSHSLGKRVVAEGVENEASFNRLADLGCDLAQGYWVSRPLGAAAIEGWIDDWTTSGAAVTPRRSGVNNNGERKLVATETPDLEIITSLPEIAPTRGRARGRSSGNGGNGGKGGKGGTRNRREQPGPPES